MIDPFDNPKLKTRKLQAALDAAGLLPANRRERPSFQAPLRKCAALLNRILVGASVPPVKLVGEPRLDARRINSAFAQIAGGLTPPEGFAFLVDNGGAYLVTDDLTYIVVETF